jgi:hypothetical protein
MKTYDELLAENEALTARFALFASLAKEAAEADESKDFLGHAWHDKYYDECTSAQCLAEIKVEAVSAFAKYINDTGELSCGDSHYVTKEAHDYVEQLRKGEQSGTWLKDSNVNGGKRQGGE